MCARFRDELQLASVDDDESQRQQPREPGRQAKRVGVHAGEERQERRPDRHEQQHIADTRFPSASDEPPFVAAATATAASPGERPTGRAVARGRRRAVRTTDRGVAAAVRYDPRSRGRAFHTARVRPVGHGSVRGHPRIKKTVTGRPTARGAGRRPSADRGAQGRTATARASLAGTSDGPVPAARRRPVRGAVRLQAAAVEHEHGGRTTGATIGRREAATAAAAATADAREVHAARRYGTAAAASGRRGRAGGRARQERNARVEIQRALFDNTGRLSRRRGRLRRLRRAQIRRARQPHGQGIATGVIVLVIVIRRVSHVFRPGNSPLTDEPHFCNDKFLSLDIPLVQHGEKFRHFLRESRNKWDFLKLINNCFLQFYLVKFLHVPMCKCIFFFIIIYLFYYINYLFKK